MSGATSPPAFRSGVVAVVGRPNVGKSALVNRLVGEKIAIVSPVPETTRTPTRGVLTLPHAQLIFVDTPGIHRPRDLLGKRMVDAARRSLADADVIVWLLDAAAGVTPEDQRVSSLLRVVPVPVIVALNKADRVDAARLATVIAAVPALPTVRSTMPVSAASSAHVDRLVETLTALLPEGPQYFPPEMATDQPEQFLVRELIREQAIAATREEVPHSVAVEIEEFAPRPGRDLTYIRAIIHVERASHKKILIGRDGQVLRGIGQQARLETERVLGKRVYLDLWVKISKGWRDRDALLRVFYPES